MDPDTLTQQAESIAEQYIAQLPPDYATRFSSIAQPDTVSTLFRGFAAGLNIRDSCLAAGISDRTFHRWTAKAEEDPDSAYGAFVTALKAQRANGKLAHLQNIARHSLKEWTASAWTLERTDPEQFALRKDTDSSPRVVVQIGITHSDVQVQVSEGLSPPEAKQLGEGRQNP